MDSREMTGAAKKPLSLGVLVSGTGSNLQAILAAIAQGRADWGVAIESVARQYDLGFLAVQDEHYDFVVPKTRFDLPAVRQFRALIADPSVQCSLAALGFRFVAETS